jgi:methanogenic corrinoid protein MtbC1
VTSTELPAAGPQDLPVTSTELPAAGPQVLPVTSTELPAAGPQVLPMTANGLPAAGPQDPRIEELHRMIVELNEFGALQTVSDLLKEGVDPEKLMFCFYRALSEIGRLFQMKEYYMMALVVAGELMREAMDMIMPHLVGMEDARETQGQIITATIEGDIHDLGKSLAGFLLRANHFEVIDLGVDVPPRVILAETLRLDPVAVGVSLLLTASLSSIRRLSGLFMEAYGDTPDRPLLFVGCAMARPEDSPQNLKEWLGVDAVADEAFDTVRICQERAELRRKLKEGLPAPF